MPDTATLLTFSGALLAPIIGTIASLLSRSTLQRKHQETEYTIKRLDLIDRAIGVGKSVSNTLGTNVDVSLAQAEYMRILRSIPEIAPSQEQDLLPFERHSFLVRLLMLPRPSSISGWIASTLFYIYLIYTPIFVLYYSLGFSERVNDDLGPEILIGTLVISLLIVAGARFWAIRAAKAALRRDREISP